MGREAETDDDVISFARAAVGSVSALELLILLRRDRPKLYRLDELVRELRSSRLAVTQALAHLMNFSLVEELPELGYTYRGGSTELDAVCERLEAEYARKPVTVVRALLEAPDEKLRMFADAFRLLGKSK